MTWPAVVACAVAALFVLCALSLYVKHLRNERKHVERLAEMARDFAK